MGFASGCFGVWGVWVINNIVRGTTLPPCLLTSFWNNIALVFVRAFSAFNPIQYISLKDGSRKTFVFPKKLVLVYEMRVFILLYSVR